MRDCCGGTSARAKLGGWRTALKLSWRATQLRRATSHCLSLRCADDRVLELSAHGAFDFTRSEAHYCLMLTIRGSHGAVVCAALLLTLAAASHLVAAITPVTLNASATPSS